jgi:hypothetical protein
MYRDKITLVIQGPMHPNAMMMLKMHAENFDIIFSTWRNGEPDEEKIDSLLRNEKLTKILFNNIESVSAKNNDQNRFYQFYTAHKGVQLTDTEYVIKVRSDEYYTDLTAFAEKMLENPEKMVTNEIFFRNPFSNQFEDFAFHPSDHLYGCKREYLEKALKKCIEDCKELSLKELEVEFADLKNRDYVIVPEQHLFGNFVKENFDILLNEGKSKEDLHKILTDYAEIVPSSELGFYCISYKLDAERRTVYDFSPSETYFNADKDLKKLNVSLSVSEREKYTYTGKKR